MLLPRGRHPSTLRLTLRRAPTGPPTCSGGSTCNVRGGAGRRTGKEGQAGARPRVCARARTRLSVPLFATQRRGCKARTEGDAPPLTQRCAELRCLLQRSPSHAPPAPSDDEEEAFRHRQPRACTVWGCIQAAGSLPPPPPLAPSVGCCCCRRRRPVWGLAGAPRALKVEAPSIRRRRLSSAMRVCGAARGLQPAGGGGGGEQAPCLLLLWAQEEAGGGSSTAGWGGRPPAVRNQGERKPVRIA